MTLKPVKPAGSGAAELVRALQITEHNFRTISAADIAYDSTMTLKEKIDAMQAEIDALGSSGS